MALAPISGKNPKESVFRQHCIFLKIKSSLEQKIIVRVAHSGDASFANAITDEMASSAQARGTGIAKRSPEYVAKK